VEFKAKPTQPPVGNPDTVFHAQMIANYEIINQRVTKENQDLKNAFRLLQ